MKVQDNPFEKFGKGKKALSVNKCGLNGVIYTRVSTKEQAETNLSLETQKKFCDEYAKKEGIKVLSFFGGTYESAQTDERKQFKKMLDFVRRSKQHISYIIVYSFDRFSRSGENAIYIASELKKQDILILAVTQLTDATTPSGKLQQNIQFIFSQYDNDLRRQKTIAGMREMLYKGEWCVQAPVGYDIVTINSERKIVMNEKGKLIRKAFLWKADEGVQSEEIVKRLKALGWNIYNQQMSNIFHNPFYCGLMAHKLLDGELVEGNHDKIISKEVFLKVNKMLSKVSHVVKWNAKNDNIPLKGFIKCECGTSFTGYIVQKKGLYYYKCHAKGCGCNVSAKKLNQIFAHILEYFTLEQKYIPVLKDVVYARFKELNEQHLETSTALERQLTEVLHKAEKLEEKFINDEIDSELFQRFRIKYREEKDNIDRQLEKAVVKTSNLPQMVDLSLNIASNLSATWVSGDYETKQKVQKMLFPEGMCYDKKNGLLRTHRVNSVFHTISNVSMSCESIKKGDCASANPLPNWVIPEGFEPSTRSLEGCCSIQLSYETGSSVNHKTVSS
jgi:site-specific DNA recombinase